MIFEVVLIEDNPDDVLLIRKAMMSSEFDLVFHVLTDGKSAIPYMETLIENGSIAADLILLDSKLTGTSGLDVLRELKGDPRFRAIPVIVFAGSVSPEGIWAFYDSGASSFVMKPIRWEDTRDALTTLCKFYFSIARLPPSSST